MTCRKRSHRSTDAGVTLIEMMVVLVIIAAVAAIIVPNVIGRPDEARVTVAQSDIRAISSALEIYRLDNQTYPSTVQGLQALVTPSNKPPIPKYWPEQGYLTTLPVDPWGNSYVYESPAADQPFSLISLGRDGVPGGDGTAADISSGRDLARQ